jgi:hypothetical protein
MRMVEQQQILILQRRFDPSRRRFTAQKRLQILQFQHASSTFVRPTAGRADYKE